MTIAARIKNFNLSQLFTLSKVFIQKPLYIIPTLNATRKTIRICDEHFGPDHHKNNSANAFRHALWNYLICEKCYKISGAVEKATNWSKKITDLHEKLAPNRELAKEMDLHNNHIGRQLFEKHLSEKIEIIAVLTEKMKEAVKIKNTADIEKAEGKLIFIEN